MVSALSAGDIWKRSRAATAQFGQGASTYSAATLCPSAASASLDFFWRYEQYLKGARTEVICHSHPLAAAIALAVWQPCTANHGESWGHLSPSTGTYDPAIWLYRLATPMAHRRAAVSVALSPEMASHIESYGVLPARIVLIPNGLNLTEIIPMSAQHQLSIGCRTP